MRTAIVFLYLGSILVMSLYSQRGSNRIKNEEDMNLGGRKQSWFSIGASAAASGCSSFAFIGMAGMSYNVGISMLWYSLLATMWSWGVFYITGKRLRRLSMKTGTTTVVDYLSARFEDKNGSLRLVATLVISFFMIAYVAANFNALAKTFQSFLGWPFAVGLSVGAIIAASYTIISGFRGSVLIDTMQSIVMILASIVFLFFVVFAAGGLTSLLTAAAGKDPNLVTVTGGKIGLTFALFLINWTGPGLMGLGNPHVAVKPMGMANEADMRLAAVWSYAINTLVMYCGVFSGLAARVWLDNLNDPDLAYGILVNEIVGPVLGGIIIAGIIAATMSTVAAQLLVASSEISTTLMRWRNVKSEKVKVISSRVFITIVAILGIIFALDANELVFNMNLYAWADLGASIGPLLILSLFWDKTTKTGGIAGMIAGAITVIVWNRLGLKAILYEGFPGFLVNIIVVYIVSQFTVAPKSAGELVNYSKQSNV